MTRMMTRILIVAVALVTVLAGCARSEPAAPPPQEGLSLDGDFSGSGPGTLVSAVTMPTIDRRIRAMTSVAARVTYMSTSGIDGSEQEVSGTVFVPRGTPPEGGWPVIAFGHGTTGVEAECGPSLSPTLLGSSDLVTSLVRAGYLVTVPDFQGLGMDGTYHPYLDATTAGNNMIDSVRAAQKLASDASNRWVAFGGSQGGQAAWAANELADAYGDGLNLLGSVSLVPAADFAGLADSAAAGTLTLDQGPLLQWLLVALKNEHPELNLDDYRRGIVADKWDVLTSCAQENSAERADVARQITPDDLRPATPEATTLLREYLFAMGLPKVRAAAPMLVIYGGRDELFATGWTETAIVNACGMGSVVEAYLQPDKGHADIDGAAAFEWIRQRFDGVQPLDACPTLTAAPDEEPADDEPADGALPEDAPDETQNGGGQ